MNKRFFAIETILLFITLCFSGCEEEKPDYIIVTCSAQILAYMYNENNQILSENPSGLSIRVDFIKAGGERSTFTCTTDATGCAEAGTASFKLYKEQPIEAVLTVQGGYLDYYPTQTEQYQTLTWEQVHEVADFGETYPWNIIFRISLYNTTIL